jgi:hypothetical protein
VTCNTRLLIRRESRLTLMVSVSLDLRFPDEVQDDVSSLCTTSISRVCLLLAWFMCFITQGGGQEGPLAYSECHVKLSALQ